MIPSNKGTSSPKSVRNSGYNRGHFFELPATGCFMSESNVKEYMAELGRKARIASRVIAAAPTALKNKALMAIANELDKSRITLVSENQKDLAAGKANGLDAAML